MTELEYRIIGILIILAIVGYIILVLILKNRPDKKETDTINHQDQNQNKTYYQQQGQILPYQLKSSVMTNHEKIMYNLLSKYCQNNKLVLLSKVRIADFVEPIYKSYTREFYRWFNKINCKHIDFLICDPNTIRPLIAIELDDYTHKYNSRKDRDIFIDNVYSRVNLPIVHFWDVNEISIRVQLNNILGIPNETKT